MCWDVSYRVQAITLVNWVLVVGLQLVEGDNMKNAKENEKRISDQRDDVR